MSRNICGSSTLHARSQRPGCAEAGLAWLLMLSIPNDLQARLFCRTTQDVAVWQHS